MEVSASSRFQVEHHGTLYLFCCQKCRARFQRDPGEFIYPEGGELDALMRSLDFRLHEPERTIRPSDWVPLLLVPGIAFLAASARQLSAMSVWDWTTCIHDFTGLMLILLSAFQLAELKAFAATFATYDLLAKAFRPYAYLYPLLELVLGLGFLVGRYLTFVSAATAGMMIFGSAGLLIALRQGAGEEGPASETTSQAPLSSGTLVANLSIAALAILIGWFGQS
jgi:YHS domain-containing protein